MMEYTSRDVTEFFNITHETVRVWSNEFARHLSPGATPGDGRHRRFTQDDIRVFSLVSELKARRMTFMDIHASLDAGQRGDLPSKDEVGIVVAEYQQKMMALQALLQDVRRERDELLEKLRPAEDENIRLRTELQAIRTMLEKRVEELTDELKSTREQANQELRTLYREIARLEVRREDQEQDD